MARRSYFNTITQRALPGVPTIAPARRLAHGWDVGGAPEAAPVKAQVSRRIDAAGAISTPAPRPPLPAHSSVVIDSGVPAVPAAAPPRQHTLARVEAMNEVAPPAEPISVQRELAPRPHRAAPPPAALIAPARPAASAVPTAPNAPVASAAPTAPVATPRSAELRAPARGEPRRAPAATALATALGAAMQWVSAPQADSAPPAPSQAPSVQASTPSPPAAREPRAEPGPAPAREALPARMPQATKLGSPPARSIHIGSIDVQIVKLAAAPPPSPVPRTERAAAAGAPSATTSPLARGFASPLGLRQS
jgi:hypothetical protein